MYSMSRVHSNHPVLPYLFHVAFRSVETVVLILYYCLELCSQERSNFEKYPWRPDTS